MSRAQHIAGTVSLTVLFWLASFVSLVLAAVIPATPYVLVLAADFNPFAILLLIAAAVMVVATVSAAVSLVRRSPRLAWRLLASSFATFAAAYLTSMLLVAPYIART